jgi:hypothetical protein
VAERVLTAELKRFIAEYIFSLEHLEILLLTRASPDKEWDVRSVYDVIKSSLAAVEKALGDLTDVKLLTRSETAYKYSPRTPEIAKLVTDLDEAYRTRRIRVIELIYSPELDALREFQRAFRLRKDQ